MSASRLFLALFLFVVSWHLGQSMELPLIAWSGMALTALAMLRVVRVEHPTLGLLFVLFATGALTGNQVLENWAIEDTWPQQNGLGAGLMISMLLYLIWVYAADRERSPRYIVNRSTQSVLVWGLLSLVMIETPESLLITEVGLGENEFDEPVSLPALVGIILATLVLLADRCVAGLARRLVLLLPVVVVLPLMLTGLNFGQGPMISALGNMMPRSRDFSSTGFSPYQTLRASVFLRPSNDPVMRIQSAELPSRYLAGNRLVSLDEELVWLPSERAVRSYDTFDAELIDGEQWRYQMDSHHYSDTQISSAMTVFSLAGDDYLFTTPNTTHVTGRFLSIDRNAADVLAPGYERGVDARWRLESGPASGPDSESLETLLLPAFWDDRLQAHSETMAGANRQLTANNIVSYFLAREYSLQTNFDPEQPFHDFYLNDRAAYCFWFASASTLALRANGIPSRLVGGYVVHEQLSEDLWLVRERDAHSWVEWQDENGYWHTIDPTPPSISAFFGGYESSSASQFYHRLAGQWQILVDRILENELAANLITWGGLAILVFLFAREYRRIRKRREELGSLRVRWQKLWQRFLRTTQLPDQNSWTPRTYRENLPDEWSSSYQARVCEFLAVYQEQRFGGDGLDGLKRVEEMLSGLQESSKATSS